MLETRTNADQQRFWDVEAGPIWVRNANAMDVCLAPVLDLVLRKTALKPGEQVLDIGCGGGTSTFAAARAVGAKGNALGADISATLLAHAAARAEAENARFTCADAETHGFEPDSVDILISRFGVMFFEDPKAAFRNMAKALRPGGRMVFAAWGQISKNPFFTRPAAISKSFLGPTPKSDPDGPGPFSFRDAEKVCTMLEQAGWHDVEVEIADINLTPKDGKEGFAKVVMQIGPAHRALEYFEAPPSQRDMLFELIIDGVQDFVKDGKLLIPAEINLFSARKR